MVSPSNIIAYVGVCGYFGGLISIIVLAVYISQTSHFASNATEEQCNVYDFNITDCWNSDCNVDAISIKYYATLESKCNDTELINDMDYGDCVCVDLDQLEGLGIQTCYVRDCDEFSFIDWEEIVDNYYLGLGISIGVLCCCLCVALCGAGYGKWYCK